MRLLKLFRNSLASYLLISHAYLYSLEIPLVGAGGGGQKSVSIGYVDMERIFQIYPQTQAAKEDYAKQLKKKREQLAEKEAELENIKSRISVLESTLKDLGGNAQSDSAAGSAVPGASETPQSLTNMKKELETKKTELEELKKRAQDDLIVFENQQSRLILGKIYQALKDLAAEEQLTIVVDKSSILYGSTDIDLTEKLQQRVRGY